MLLSQLLPERRATKLRTGLIRLMGFRIGKGTRFLGLPKFQSSPRGPLGPRLLIGAECTIGTGVILEFGGKLSIGDRVLIGDGAAILTTTHQLGPKENRAGPAIRAPIVIGSDVSIGAGAIILPGAMIGDAARVLPESVVNVSVAPGVTVGGMPARPKPPLIVRNPG
jgi:acetyltransferase-like isoleucine patch superfamily enzyme